MSVRSSSLSSLQQIPSARVVLPHFATRGVVTPGAAWSIGQTGGFVTLEADSCLGGRGTAADTEGGEFCGEDMMTERQKIELHTSSR